MWDVLDKEQVVIESFSATSRAWSMVLQSPRTNLTACWLSTEQLLPMPLLLVLAKEAKLQGIAFDRTIPFSVRRRLFEDDEQEDAVADMDVLLERFFKECSWISARAEERAL